MDQLTEFEKNQIETCKHNIKNAKSDIDREWWESMLNEYITCLKVHFNKEIDL